MKAERKISFNNCLRIVFWVMVLATTNWLILNEIEEHFWGYANSGVILMDSYNKYCNSLKIMLGCAFAISIIWWLLAYSSMQPVRECIENYTLFCAVLAVVMCFAVSVIIYRYCPGIVKDNGNTKGLIYTFCYPCIFTAALFSASPNNINKVIVPYGDKINFLIAVLFLAAGIIIGFIGGI